MTSRTSVYMTDELRQAVAKDGRSLSDLIRAGLELPSPVRFSKTDLQSLEAVRQLIDRTLRALHTADDSPTTNGQPNSVSKRRSAQGPSDSKRTRGQGGSASHSSSDCPRRVPKGAFCSDCQKVHAA